MRAITQGKVSSKLTGCKMTDIIGRLASLLVFFAGMYLILLATSPSEAAIGIVVVMMTFKWDIEEKIMRAQQ